MKQVNISSLSRKNVECRLLPIKVFKIGPSATCCSLSSWTGYSVHPWKAYGRKLMTVNLCCPFRLLSIKWYRYHGVNECKRTIDRANIWPRNRPSILNAVDAGRWQLNLASRQYTWHIVNGEDERLSMTDWQLRLTHEPGRLLGWLAIRGDSWRTGYWCSWARHGLVDQTAITIDQRPQLRWRFCIHTSAAAVAVQIHNSSVSISTGFKRWRTSAHPPDQPGGPTALTVLSRWPRL